MANEEHLKILKQGIETWNKWREENRKGPDLSNADLDGADLAGADFASHDMTDSNGADLSNAILGNANLSEANLSNANLSNAILGNANLSEANLSKAILSKAYLSGAYLTGADLTGANLGEAYLSGAAIDENTLYSEVKGCEVGVNGFWCKETDSAALMTLNPPGNSMQGSNPNAVIESLKRARRLHGQSMALAGAVLLVAILGLEKIKYLGQELTLDKFGMLAIPISIGLLSLVVFFMSDGLKGARYLRGRGSAMTVGNFPWVLSKFAGEGWSKVQSFLTRAVVSFHPLAYLYYLLRWEFTIEPRHLPAMLYSALMVLLLGFSAWIFLISHRFQKPILFDNETEKARQDDLVVSTDRQTAAINQQTVAITQQAQVVSELVTFLKSTRNDKPSKEKTKAIKKANKQKTS